MYILLLSFTKMKTQGKDLPQRSDDSLILKEYDIGWCLVSYLHMTYYYSDRWTDSFAVDLNVTAAVVVSLLHQISYLDQH